MFMVKILGDEGAQLDGVCDEEEKPVEENHAVRVAGSPMLNVLDIEDDAERYEGEYGGPEAEVAGPYICVVFDL
jgi:hypothetical protein